MQVLLQFVFCAANGWLLPINLYDHIFFTYTPFISFVIGICVILIEIVNYLVTCRPAYHTTGTDTELADMSWTCYSKIHLKEKWFSHNCGMDALCNILQNIDDNLHVSKINIFLFCECFSPPPQCSVLPPRERARERPASWKNRPERMPDFMWSLQ